jgi:hypothetical protein
MEELSTPSAFPAGLDQPEPSSLNDILRKNNRDRLFVRPMRWTSQHLRLLGCQFLLEEEEPPAESQQPDTEKIMRRSDFMTYLFRDREIRSWEF